MVVLLTITRCGTVQPFLALRVAGTHRTKTSLGLGHFAGGGREVVSTTLVTDLVVRDVPATAGLGLNGAGGNEGRDQKEFEEGVHGISPSVPAGRRLGLSNTAHGRRNSSPHICPDTKTNDRCQKKNTSGCRHNPNG